MLENLTLQLSNLDFKDIPNIFSIKFSKDNGEKLDNLFFSPTTSQNLYSKASRSLHKSDKTTKRLSANNPGVDSRGSASEVLAEIIAEYSLSVAILALNPWSVLNTDW